MPNVPAPQVTALSLDKAIDEALHLFLRADDARTVERPHPDKWSAREVLGHLIDSACNNHRRFVVGQSASTSRFEAYEQNVWVERQRYHDVAWDSLVALWAAYNRHLAHVMRCTPPDAAERAALAPDGSGPVSVGALMDDYVTHLRHHVAQIQSRLERRDAPGGGTSALGATREQ